MELIYNALNLLPFDFLRYDFMKNAFLAVLLIAPLFGLLSTMVVNNKMAFFSDSLGHGAFTGLAIGSIVGFLTPFSGLVVFSILFALLITYIKNKSKAATDTIIGVFSSMGIAIGLMIMSYGGNFNKFTSYLIGDILSIRTGDIVNLALLLVVVVLAWGLLFNKLLLISINPSFAKSRGINVNLVEGLFASLVAVVVAMSIEWVGLLIINSLLILPGASSRNIASDVKSYHLISVGLAVVSGVLGLLLAYFGDMTAGASIVIIASIFFFITFFLKGKVMAK